jgi:hypothetical protein
MDGQVNTAVSQCTFQFGRKQPFAANLWQRLVQRFIPLRYKRLQTAF